jgi:multisubunit Na+/H+ antiporter MnhB subunit
MHAECEMGRDSWTFREKDRERAKRKKINPIWRGVGCILVVILGIVGYFFAGWFMEQGIIYFPAAIRRPAFAPWLPENALVQGVIAFLFMLLSYAIINTIYAVAFPIKLGEKDAPPMKRGQPRDRY